MNVDDPECPAKMENLKFFIKCHSARLARLENKQSNIADVVDLMINDCAKNRKKCPDGLD